MTARISLGQQLAELSTLRAEHGEICRVAVYRGQRSERELAFRLARLDAAIGTLAWLATHELTIKQRLGS